jgi:hypothetical protein
MPNPNPHEEGDKAKPDIRQVQEAKEPEMPAGIPIQAEGKLTMAVPEGLKMILTREAFAQLFGYVYATSLEVSCLGSVTQEGEVFKVNRFYLVKQTCSSAHTELSPEAVAELAERLLKEGKGDEVRAIRCWAHSHPGMGLFWSRTDEENCHTLVSDYLVSLVVGQGFSARCRIDIARPIAITLDYVPVLHETVIDKDLILACRNEVKEKLSSAPLFGNLPDVPGFGQPSLFSDKNENCMFCGNWHAPRECPLEQEYGPFDWGDLDYSFGREPAGKPGGHSQEDEPCE